MKSLALRIWFATLIPLALAVALGRVEPPATNDATAATKVHEQASFNPAQPMTTSMIPANGGTTAGRLELGFNYPLDCAATTASLRISPPPAGGNPSPRWEGTTLSAFTSPAAGQSYSTVIEGEIVMSDGKTISPGGSWNFGGAAAGYSSSVLSARPAAYWRLGEASDQTAALSLSAGSADGRFLLEPIHGPVLGAGSLLSSDSENTSAYLDATKGQYLVGAAPGVDLPPNSFSAEIWFRTTSPSGTLIGDSVSREGGSTPLTSGWHLRIVDGKLRAELGKGRGCGNCWTVLHGPRANDGRPHHAVLTRDGDQTRLYLDGDLITNRTVRGYVPAESALMIGARLTDSRPGIVDFLTGHVDEAAVYERPLSRLEIKQHTLVGRGMWKDVAIVGSKRQAGIAYADHGSWSRDLGLSIFEHHWQTCRFSRCVDIPDQSSGSLVLTEDLVGTQLRVRLSTSAGQESALSPLTEIIEPHAHDPSSARPPNAFEPILAIEVAEARARFLAGG